MKTWHYYACDRKQACLKLLKGLGCLKPPRLKCAQASSCLGCVRTVAPLTHLLSGAPCRLPPGSAGQRCAGLYLLHPGHLRVCGSALHPQQRKEVHHLRSLSGPRLWVSLRSGVFTLARFLPSLTPSSASSSSPGLCIMIAASIYTDRFHLDEQDGWYGHCYILAWISFALTFISAITYFVLRKKTAWKRHWCELQPAPKITRLDLPSQLKPPLRC